jgi:hypothetical protein
MIHFLPLFGKYKGLSDSCQEKFNNFLIFFLTLGHEKRGGEDQALFWLSAGREKSSLPGGFFPTSGLEFFFTQALYLDTARLCSSKVLEKKWVRSFWETK